MCVSYDLNMESPWLMAWLSWVWGGTAPSAHVFHPDWTICQHKSCSIKKMNCMYSSNSRHLILASLAAIQLVVSTGIHTGAHHFQKTLRVFACWLQSTRQHGDWTRPSPYAVLSWKSSAKRNLLTCTSAPPQSTSWALLQAQVSWHTTAPTAISGSQHVGCAVWKWKSSCSHSVFMYLTLI